MLQIHLVLVEVMHMLIHLLVMTLAPQISAPSGFSLRVQYIDVIVCSFD